MERIPMKLSQLFSEVKVINSNIDFDTEVAGISENSAKCKSGYIFVCIKGTRSDGNSYINDAIANGAVCVVTENDTDAGIPAIKVESTRKALSVLWAAWYGYPARSLKLIGITGTNGKTSTAYMLKAILDAAGKKAGLIGTVRYIAGENTYASELTTPDPETMQRLLYEMKQSGHEFVVCEVSSHSLFLDKLFGVEFDTAVFTNLSQDHLDFHGTMENYFLAKKKLFSMCKSAVINTDNVYGKRIADDVNCPVVACSINSNEADICAKNIRTKENCVEYEFLSEGNIYRISCPVAGMFSVYNSMLAAAAAEHLGISANDITVGIRNMGTVTGRMERVDTGRDFSVIIDFAHTPGALLNVLHSIREYASGRVVCLFGCGGDRDKTKRAVMGKIAAENSDYVIITSDNPRSEDPLAIISDILEGVISVEQIKDRYTVIESREEAIRYAIKNALPNDTVLLAGKGHEDYYIDREGKHPFDERAIVRDEISRRK